MTYDHHNATTGEADAYRAGQAAHSQQISALLRAQCEMEARHAALQEWVNLALTHLRAELERSNFRDMPRVAAAYRVLGGVGAAEAVEPAQPPQETLAEASERKQAEYEKQRALIHAAAIKRYTVMGKVTYA